MSNDNNYSRRLQISYTAYRVPTIQNSAILKKNRNKNRLAINK